MFDNVIILWYPIYILSFAVKMSNPSVYKGLLTFNGCTIFLIFNNLKIFLNLLLKLECYQVLLYS